MTDAPKLRGFALMKARNPERLMEIARHGGRSVPSESRSYSQDRDLAVKSGRVGGKVSKRPKAAT